MWYHIPVDCGCDTQCCGNFKSHTSLAISYCLKLVIWVRLFVLSVKTSAPPKPARHSIQSLDSNNSSSSPYDDMQGNLDFHISIQ